MSIETAAISPPLLDYLAQINPSEHPVLQQLRQQTAQHRKGNMAIAPEQAALLVWLAKLIRAEKYLEIGVFTGYSSTALALALPEHGKITACDINASYTEYAQQAWQQAQVAHKITLHLQPAIFTLDELIANGESNSYDMALIDADKPPTPEYYERCLTLIRSGGIIAIDNILLNGRVYQTHIDNPPPALDIIRTFNANLRHDKRVHVITLPLGDGLTLLQKK